MIRKRHCIGIEQNWRLEWNRILGPCALASEHMFTGERGVPDLRGTVESPENPAFWKENIF